jgi:hypothetical protein
MAGGENQEHDMATLFELREGYSGPFAASDIANHGAMAILSKARYYNIQRQGEPSTLDWFLLAALFHTAAHVLEAKKGLPASAEALYQLAKLSHREASASTPVRAVGEVIYKRLIPKHSDALHQAMAEVLDAYNSGVFDEI